MKRFDVVDGSRRGAAPCAILEYDPETREFDVRLAPGVKASDVPLMFAPFVERGEDRLGSAWSRRWVEERIVPTGRQNLGQVLRANGLDEYDECALLEGCQGRCSQDDFFLRPHVGGFEYAFVDFSRQVGEDLRKARIEAGMTQSDVALKTGVQQAVISRLERGEGNPTIKMLQDIAAGLGRTWEFRLV